MPASYPKPDDERVRRNSPTFGWVDLPSTGRDGPAPELPRGVRQWGKITRDAWEKLWASPQATQWDPTGRTLWAWAVCHHDLVQEEMKPAPLLAQMQSIEDRHGLSPKAMLQLRWRVVDVEPADAAPPAPDSVGGAGDDRRSRLLRMIPGGVAAS
jgi:hypothetical protein